MRALLIVLATTALLCACGEGGVIPPSPKVDQCMRTELFKVCMAALPAGPQATKYNDWAEVVKECGDIAYYQSLRRPGQIKPECSP